ncbi:bifunctional 5-dehydro-2-deoxygluconokinase/5-dehydro-2-deoxyphosphogluconate aldolase [Microvirga massiliensis]|uniref:bifunctional 5-dehydro-2-deoxygluconokinase/5-dehydro-2- deoxyphosphogluconate aldolase n=1 Tax=Microvirga massiliensis TaxID=1033741 RepID=UPI00062B3042|nr:5-dehydro-2-deoxygluconokinase [Microvirga massiliensis]
MNTPDLDVISIGRSSVDLYGQQIGGRLEDMATFAKSVGGCPTNIAIGAARLGLRSAVITGVGDEHMGRFIVEQLEREGVCTNGVKVDPARLTALVILGVRSDTSFPLIFYRENCADMGLTEADIDEAFIARARAIVVTGTHFSTPSVDAMSRKAMCIARALGRKVVLDVDYRPNLWGLAGHGAGEDRYIRSEEVSARLQTLLPDLDLIVGTEEELHIAGGSQDTLESLRTIRRLSAATIVCKRGPMGCVVFPGTIPERLVDGISGPGFPVEVYNVLGAGDAFMAGFLRGWLRGEPLEQACTYANACGAFAVSRLLCSPEYPTWTELQHFLHYGSATPALRHDETLSHLHWVTTRQETPLSLRALAIDHRIQLEALADRVGAPRERIGTLKRLAVRAAAEVAQGRDGFGLLLDGEYGREALFDAAGENFWIGRPIEVPGSRPLAFVAHDLGSHLVEWPLAQTVKCLCFYHPDDPADLRERQDAALLALHEACRTTGRELLIEIIAGKHGELRERTVADVLAHLYDLGIRPDWWKLEPQNDAAAWRAIEEVIAARDPHCRGVVMLGLEAPEEELAQAFESAAESPIVRGFAIGRTIFGDVAESWLAGRMTDDDIVAEMAGRFRRFVEAWDRAMALRPAA